MIDQPGIGERESRIRQVVDDCILRRAAGETLPDEQVVTEHSALMPELGSALDRLALVEQAERRFRDSSRSTRGPDDVTVCALESLPAYDFVGEISRGGQGIVYQAVQRRTRRDVAIKVLSGDTHAASDRAARFEREVGILGRLNHPNILSIHDTGSVAGSFYYVMDYVSGEPLDEFVNTNTPSTREILDLFVKVCDAVSAAHLLGIIHRDLKPSNILVDRQGNPKVLDFGLAKLMSEDIVERTMTTTGEFVGSLLWASPEQIAGSPHEIDVRTDVYSIGVMLYHTLVHRFPYPTSGGVRETIDNILTADPVRPSEIDREVDHEVETIVLKCLAKARDRRYGTAGELARDLRHYLAGEPIDAKRDSVGYVLGKHLRRHKLSFAIAAAFVLVVTFGLLTSLMFWREAALERDAAKEAGQVAEAAHAEAERQTAVSQAVNEFLNDDLLAAANPNNSRNREITVREVLDEASIRIEDRFPQQPMVEASVRVTLGKTYSSLGEYDAAAPHFEHALALLGNALGREDPETLSVMNKLAVLYFTAARYEEAEALMSETLEVRRRVLGEEHADTLVSMNNQAKLYEQQGRYPDAEALLEITMETQKRVLGAEDPDTLLSMNNLAGIYSRQGRHEEAESLYLTVLEGRRRVLGPEDSPTLTTLNDLAMVYQRQGRYAEAEPLFVRLAEARREVYGDDHPGTLTALSNLAGIYQARGRYAKAEPLLTSILEARRRVLGPDHPRTASAVNALAVLYARLGRYDEAIPLCEEAIEMRRRILGPDHPRTQNSMINLAVIHKDLGHYGEAESLLKNALETQRRVLGAEHPQTLKSMGLLARTYLEQARYDEAEQLTTRGLEAERRVLGEQHPNTLASLYRLGHLHLSRDRYDQAEPIFLKVLQARRDALGDQHPHTAASMTSLGKLYRLQGRYGEAEPLLLQAIESYGRVVGEVQVHTLVPMFNLALVFHEQERTLEAEPLMRKVFDGRRERFGADHGSTLEAQHGLAMTLTALERYEEAESLLLDSYPRIESTAERPDELTRAACQRMVNLYEAWGKAGKAAKWRAKMPGPRAGDE